MHKTASQLYVFIEEIIRKRGISSKAVVLFSDSIVFRQFRREVKRLVKSIQN
jgi:hypothetical protein